MWPTTNGVRGAFGSLGSFNVIVWSHVGLKVLFLVRVRFLPNGLVEFIQQLQFAEGVGLAITIDGEQIFAADYCDLQSVEVRALGHGCLWALWLALCALFTGASSALAGQLFGAARAILRRPAAALDADSVLQAASERRGPLCMFGIARSKPFKCNV